MTNLKNGNGNNGALRWAILGCGTISNNFVKALGIADRNHQVTVIASFSLEKAEEFKKRLNLAPVVKVFDDYKAALQEECFDVVYIGLLASEHKEMSTFALEQGKHVLCEKPLGLDEKETRQIVEAASKRELFLMEGYWSRFFPAWQTLRTHLKEVGEIQMVHCSMCFNRKTGHDLTRPYSVADFKHSIPTINHLGSNVNLGIARDRILFSAGCYTVMFALFVFDGEMPEKITAVGQLDEDGNDLWGSVTMEFSGNRVANLFYSGIVNSLNSAMVAGSNGTLRLPDRFWCSTELVEAFGTSVGIEKTHVHKFPIPKESKGFDYPNGNAFYLEADHVYDCIKNGKIESEIMPLEESLKIAQITDEIRRQILASSTNRSCMVDNNHLKVNGVHYGLRPVFE